VTPERWRDRVRGVAAGGDVNFDQRRYRWRVNRRDYPAHCAGDVAGRWTRSSLARRSRPATEVSGFSAFAVEITPVSPARPARRRRSRARSAVRAGRRLRRSSPWCPDLDHGERAGAKHRLRRVGEQVCETVRCRLSSPRLETPDYCSQHSGSGAPTFPVLRPSRMPFGDALQRPRFGLCELLGCSGSRP